MTTLFKTRDMTGAPAADFASLVTDTHVHRDVYTSPDVFRAEMAHLFGRAWVYVGHESQIRTPGDWITAHVGTQEIVVSRGSDGAVHAIYNRCTHRGSTLCAARSGHDERGLQCPYHGWLFDHDGTLKSVPHAGNYEGALDTRDYAITKVARLESYRGFLFANLDAGAGPLGDFLGHMKTSIDDMVDRAPDGEVECGPHVLRHFYRANWKMTFENLNDVIHPGFAHAASVIAAKKVAADVGGAQNLVPTLGMMMANGKPISFFQASDMVTAPGGHSYIGGHMGAEYSGDTGSAYFQALAARHGEEGAKRVLSVDRHLMLLYPSSTWHARYQTVRIVRPVAPDLTEVIGFTFRLKGAPEETWINALEYCNGANSAASPVIADDLEIYERCHEGNLHGDQEWIPMTRGLKEHRDAPPGTSGQPATSEAYIRNQFKAWAAYMGGA
ncbi:MAG: Rieske 2Fe-2S domain-containing protein [Oceanicaulis sp.]